MSTLAKIEAAVDQLPPAQKEKLHAFLEARLEVRSRKGLSPEKF